LGDEMDTSVYGISVPKRFYKLYIQPGIEIVFL
jgi:hypothetical protein